MTKLQFLTALISILCFQIFATLVRSFSREMLSSLQEVDLRLKDLKDRMEHVNGVSLQVERFLDLLDLCHTSVWCRAHRKRQQSDFVSLAW